MRWHIFVGLRCDRCAKIEIYAVKWMFGKSKNKLFEQKVRVAYCSRAEKNARFDDFYVSYVLSAINWF